MAKDKKIIMQEGRARLVNAGLVPFGGYCFPETKVKIKKMEKIDREKAANQ